MEKKKVGFNLPTVIAGAMDDVSERVSGKEKWVVVTAAMVLFLRQSEESQNRLMAEVKAADAPGRSFGELLGDAVVEPEPVGVRGGRVPPGARRVGPAGPVKK